MPPSTSTPDSAPSPGGTSTPDSTPPSAERQFLGELRRRRAELHDSMVALEQALAAPPAVDRTRWAQRVHVALVELSADFRDHISITEGPDGLYAELARTAPRLSGSVAVLTHEHTLVKDLLTDLLSRVEDPAGSQDVETVRALGTDLLGGLVRHRQRGSDLVYEAYQVDIGGET